MYKNERERRVDVGRRRPQQVEMRMAESQTACCFVVLVLSGSPLSSPPIYANERNTTWHWISGLCWAVEYNKSFDIMKVSQVGR